MPGENPFSFEAARHVALVSVANKLTKRSLQEVGRSATRTGAADYPVHAERFVVGYAWVTALTASVSRKILGETAPDNE